MFDRNSVDLFLDITNDLCPLTFVKAKLSVERMTVGQTIEVRLKAGEPLENVPRSLAELGHSILAVEAENADDPQGVYRLWVQKR